MIVKTPYKSIEWNKVHNHHVLIITKHDGERIVHSGLDKKRLENLAKTRYQIFEV